MNRVVFAAIFGASILLFSIDGSISAVADFLIPLTTSSLGISLFIVLCVVFVAISLVSFRLISETVSQTVAISKYFRIMYYIALVTQGSLICILFVILFQILTSSQYSTFLLSAATAIIASSSTVISAISSMILFGWYRVNRASYVALVFTVAFILSVYINIYLGTSHTIKLVDKPDYIRPDSEVIYPSDTYEPGTFNFVMRDVYRIASIGIFLLFLIASATMLHHYAAKIGRAKFWALIILPTVYYVSILVDTLGLYVPKSDTELFNYYLYVSLNGLIGGALLGFAFWSIAKAMKASKAVANYLRLCSYGFVLNFIAGVGTLVAAAYPPFGFVSFSMLTLSSYMIILGLYLTAVSISQDIKLRQFVKEVSKADTGFLSTISQAQMERQVQAKATDLEKVIKEQRRELEKESGIQSSLQQQDIKQYLLEVLQEVDKHKSTK